MGFPAEPNSPTLQNIGSSLPPLPQRTLTSTLQVAYMKGDALRVSTPSWDIPRSILELPFLPGGLQGTIPGQLLPSACGQRGTKGREVRNLTMPPSGLESVHIVHPEKWQLQPQSGEPWLRSKSLLATYLCGNVGIKCSWQRAESTTNTKLASCHLFNPKSVWDAHKRQACPARG